MNNNPINPSTIYTKPPMTVLLIEDEAPAAHRLTRLLAETNPAIRVVATIPSVAASVRWLQESQFIDLIISDIHLSDGLSFEIFRQVEPPAPIIFTTAYDEYAIQAFKLNSVDYLLKPIVADELRAALAKFERTRLPVSSPLIPAPVALNIDALLRSLHQPATAYRQRFLVSYKESFLPVPATDVAYFQSENKVTRLVRPDGRWFPLPETLDDLTAQLDPRQFFRANRQVIVSMTSVQAAHQHFNGKLKLSLLPAPADEVMVSRERAGEFKAWLNG
jgi:two-component system, LytTR family, response regulator LytT